MRPSSSRFRLAIACALWLLCQACASGHPDGFGPDASTPFAPEGEPSTCFGADLFEGCHSALLMPSALNEGTVVLDEGIGCGGGALCPGAVRRLMLGARHEVRVRAVRGPEGPLSLESAGAKVIEIIEVEDLPDPCLDGVRAVRARIHAVGVGATELVVKLGGEEAGRYLIDVERPADLAIGALDILERSELRGETLVIERDAALTVLAVIVSSSGQPLFAVGEVEWSISDDRVAHFPQAELRVDVTACGGTDPGPETAGRQPLLQALDPGTATLRVRVGELSSELMIEVVDSLD